jgi:hypothetical protein
MEAVADVTGTVLRPDKIIAWFCGVKHAVCLSVCLSVFLSKDGKIRLTADNICSDLKAIRSDHSVECC